MSTLVARSAERINPVLLKEVRAALRGRWFRSTFAIVLSLATVASLLFLMFNAGSQSPTQGSAYFGIMAACMAFGVHGLVPFSAMLSMTAESDEHTLELLQLSNLAGWRIVLGKLGSAMLQYLLIASAFAPFLTVAFLMRGVAFSTVALTLLSSALFCTAQCSVGLMLGSLARARWARIVLLLVFAFGLLQFSPMGLFFFFFVGSMGRMAPAGFGFFGTASIALVLACMTVACVSTAIAAGRLAHGEENQSTPMRVATTILILTGCGFALTADTTNQVLSALIATIVCASPLLYFIVTERERLPRAVAAHVPRWSRVFPLQAWLPGGGRGALYVLVHAALIVIAFQLAQVLNMGGRLEWSGDFRTLSGALMCAIVFLLLPSAALVRLTPTSGGRAAARAIVMLFIVGANIGPLFLSFLMQRPQVADWVPFVAAFQPPKSPYYSAPFDFLCVMTGLAVIANVPRLFISLREVSAAAALQRAPAQAHAASVV